MINVIKPICINHPPVRHTISVNIMKSDYFNCSQINDLESLFRRLNLYPPYGLLHRYIFKQTSGGC